MRKLLIYIYIIFQLFINSALAEPYLATIELSQSGPFQIPGNEENCLLVHQNKNDSDVITFSISVTEQNQKNRLRIDVGTENDHPVDEMKIERAGLSYYSLTSYDRIILETEINQDKLSDDEIFALHDKAEAVEGQSDPGFAAFQINVEGKAFKEYVKNIRDTERFPALHVAEVSMRIENIAVKESSEDLNFEQASAKYNGPCQISLMLE